MNRFLHLSVLFGFSGLFLLVAFGATLGQTSQNSKAEQVRARVAKIGTGSDSKVEVKLRDGSKIAGTIESISTDSFSITDLKSKTSRNIAYADVEDVKKRRKSLGTGVWIAIAAAAAAVVTLIILKPVFCDGGAAC